MGLFVPQKLETLAMISEKTLLKDAESALKVAKAQMKYLLVLKSTPQETQKRLSQEIKSAQTALTCTIDSGISKLSELTKLLKGENYTTILEDDIITDEGYDEYGNYIGDQEEDENEVEEEPTPAQNWTPPKLTDALRAKFKAMSSNEVE